MFARMIFLFVLLGFLPVYAQGSAVLKSPDYIQVLAIDDNEKDSVSAAFGSGAITKELFPGVHFLKVRYSDLFDIDQDEHETVNSKPVAIEFIARAGYTYQLMLDRPQTLSAAQAFARNAVIHVLEVESNTKIATSTTLYQYRLAQRQAQQQRQPVLASTPKPVRPTGTATMTNSNNLETLKTIWATISAEEKQAFMKWVYSK